MSTGAGRVRAGRVELAVRRDLRALGAAGKGALAELALVLARAIDGRPEALATTAKLVQELRVTLGQLREVARAAGGDGEEVRDYSTPVWDGADAGPADSGSAGGGGRPPAG